MAMIKCRECGREISDQAPSCPYCGAPSAKKVADDANQQTASKWTAIGVVLFLVGTLLSFIAKSM